MPPDMAMNTLDCIERKVLVLIQASASLWNSLGDG